MTPIPSNLIPPCCKPTQQHAYPDSCSLFPTVVATCWMWAQDPSLQWNHLTRCKPWSSLSSSYFDQLWSTVSKNTLSTWVVPCQSIHCLGMPGHLLLLSSAITSGLCRWAWGRFAQLAGGHPDLRISVLLWNTGSKRCKRPVCTALEISFPLSVLQL